MAMRFTSVFVLVSFGSYLTLKFRLQFKRITGVKKRGLTKRNRILNTLSP